MITWDENKRLANIDKHGLDFAEIDERFFLTALVRPAKLNRFQAIGRLHDGTISVIFVTLGTQGLSIVSMRPARKDERKLLL